jgi:hypothetical protein
MPFGLKASVYTNLLTKVLQLKVVKPRFVKPKVYKALVFKQCLHKLASLSCKHSLQQGWQALLAYQGFTNFFCKTCKRKKNKNFFDSNHVSRKKQYIWRQKLSLIEFKKGSGGSQLTIRI